MLVATIAVWTTGSQLGATQVESLLIDSSTAASSAPDSLRQAIAGLRSQNFLQRERAQKRLAEFGESALRPLAIEMLERHPESSWRARQVLEKIGTTGTESTFLKAIGILQIFFNEGNLELESRLAQLEYQWRLERKNHILETLRAKGATINDNSRSSQPIGDDLELWPRQQVIEMQWIGEDDPEIIIRQRGIRFDNRSESGTGEEKKSGTANNGNVPSAAKLTDQELMTVVDQILAASIEENRRKFYQQPSRSAVPESAELAGELFLNLEIQRNIIRPGMEWETRYQAIEIRLGPKWKGEDFDLDRLLEIDAPLVVGLEKVDLHPAQFTSLSTLKNVVEVIVTGNELPAEKLGWLDSFPNLKKLTLENRLIDAETARAIGQINPIRYLSLTGCQLTSASFSRMSELENLNYLNLREIDIPADAFDALRSCPRLRFINLDLCKFPKDAFLKFSRFRPDVQINFTPRAFLGVQAVTFDTDGNPCEISRVVPNSAADKAGLLAGDIIKKIDGQRIAKFEELRLHVAQHQPGERLELEVERNGQRLDLTVELMPFDENLR